MVSVTLKTPLDFVGSRWHTSAISHVTFFSATFIFMSVFFWVIEIDNKLKRFFHEFTKHLSIVGSSLAYPFFSLLSFSVCLGALKNNLPIQKIAKQKCGTHWIGTWNSFVLMHDDDRWWWCVKNTFVAHSLPYGKLMNFERRAENTVQQLVRG